MTVDLLALEQALSASTAGEWQALYWHFGAMRWKVSSSADPEELAEVENESDAQFIALAHNSMEALLQELRELRSLRNDLLPNWYETPEEQKRLDEIYSEDMDD